MGNRPHRGPLESETRFANLLELGQKAIRDLQDSDLQSDEFFKRLLRVDRPWFGSPLVFSFRLGQDATPVPGSFIGNIWELTGYTQDEWNRLGMTLESLTLPEESLRFTSAYKGLVIENRPFELNSTIITKSGDKSRIIIRGFALSETQSESYTCTVIGERQSGFSVDTTVDYKDPYQVIVENLPHMVFLKNLDSVYLTYNAKLAKFMDINPIDIVGKTDEELFSPELAEQFQYEDRQTLGQGIPRQYIQELHRDGKKIFMQITKIPVQNKSGMNLGILGILFEITDTVVFKEYIENQRSKRDLVVENRNDVFYKIDFKTREVYISDTIFWLTGYRPAEQLSRGYDEWFDRESLANFRGLKDLYLKALMEKATVGERGKYYRKMDLRLRRKDGGTVWVESVSNIFFNRTGEVRGVIGLFRNIHDRKELESQVQAALEKANRLSQAQAQIISTISHEFRTPISILQSNLQLIMQYRNRLEEESLDEIFELSIEAVKAINHTLNNISFLSKNQRGAFNLARENLDLNRLIRKMVRELTCIPEYANRIHCSIRLNSNSHYLDPVMLKHIVNNLLINALNYSSIGQRVRLTIEEQGEWLQFTVRDQGIGIPEEEQDRIFESFFRASNVGSVKGSGLGLAIVKECIHLQGGKIRVFSKPGEGTEVEFTIPVEYGGQ